MTPYYHSTIFRDDLIEVASGIIILGGISHQNGIAYQASITSDRSHTISAPTGISVPFILPVFSPITAPTPGAISPAYLGAESVENPISGAPPYKLWKDPLTGKKYISDIFTDNTFTHDFPGRQYAMNMTQWSDDGIVVSLLPEDVDTISKGLMTVTSWISPINIGFMTVLAVGSFIIEEAVHSALRKRYNNWLLQHTAARSIW